MKKQKKLLCTIIMALMCLMMSIPVSAAPKISKSKATMVKGQTLQLKVTGTKSKAKWISSKKSVATVSSKGKVTAKKKGTTTVTAKIGKKKYNCKITVETPSLSKKTITINVGKSTTIKLNGTKQKVTWKTSNSKVATVKNGKITGKSSGTATITAIVSKKKYTCKVTVKSKSAETKGSVSYKSESTDFGTVIIAKNNYSHIVDLSVDCIYYKSGTMVKKSSDSCYALEPGRECALIAWISGVSYDSYKVNMKVKKATNIIGNASNIKVTSNFGNDYNVMATVKNAGKKNEYTHLAVVYYQNGKIVGYDDTYADVKTNGSVDYVEFYHPYDKNYKNIVPDSYKIYVNESYTYTWMQ